MRPGGPPGSPSTAPPPSRGATSGEREPQRRWMEVLKKMMHHHTLTALCVSAESVRQRARERVVITKLLRGGRARRGSCVRQSADGTFKSSGRGSSLLAAAISERANFHLKEHSAPLPPPAPSPSSLFTVRHLSHLSPSSAAVHPSSPFFPRRLHRIHLTTFMPPFFFSF